MNNKIKLILGTAAIICNISVPLYSEELGGRTNLKNFQTSNLPKADPNRDYGFNQYGFKPSTLNYLNQQKQRSFVDAGIGFKYDTATQTFSGSTFGPYQYGNIPLSVIEQVATTGDKSLLQPYQVGGGRGQYTKPKSISKDHGVVSTPRPVVKNKRTEKKI